jgi:lantibiotic modifying enzyme
MVPERGQGRLLGRDLDEGLAGVVLVLAQFVEKLGIPGHTKALRSAAARLDASAPIGPDTLPGLYVGEAGIAWALLRAGDALGDPRLLRAALERGTLVTRLPHTSPDMYHGSAGRLRFHLGLWRATGDPMQRTAALAAGDALVRAAERHADGSMFWRIPAGYGPLSGVTHLGFAHGVAGIGDALLQLWSACGDRRLLAAVHGAFCALRKTAISALDDDSGLAWPVAPGEDLAPAYWCHGAAGVGQFLLSVAASEISPDAQSMAARAASTVARGTRWAGPCRCHGLAGGIEFLLAVHRRTRDASWLVEARSLAGLLEGAVLSAIDAPQAPYRGYGPIGPGLLTGIAGVAGCFLQLSDPERSLHEEGAL